MPPRAPPPTFDYYAELEVERTASLAQITSSYRNLARCHHPDRNFGKEEEATEKFQRIQQAYEILSDPNERRRYDSTTSDFASDYSDSSFRNDFSPADEQVLNEFLGHFASPEFLQRFRASQTSANHSSASGHNGPANSEHYRSLWVRFGEVLFQEQHLQEEQRGRQREREAFTERSRREEEKAEQDATRTAKQASEAHDKAHDKAKACEEENAERDAMRTAKQASEGHDNDKAKAREEEKQSQEQRWKDQGIATEDEKSLTCLHSNFCAKVQQKKKFKCSACSAKRGMIAFECPYCSASLCQLCVTNFSTKRGKLAKSTAEDRTAPTQESATNNNSQTASPSHNDDASSTEHRASSSHQTSSRDKHSSGSGESGGSSGGGGNHLAFVRPLKMQHRITHQMLRPAMERFGAVASIQLSGRAVHVGFADQEALRRAIAASPVVLTTTISVSVTELKVCDSCGKLGHVAQQCLAEI